MNVKLIIRILVLLLITTHLYSCKKDSDVFVPYNTSDFTDTTWNNSSISQSKISAMTKVLSKTLSTPTFSANANATNDFDASTQLETFANSLMLNGVGFSGSAKSTVAVLAKKGDYIRNLTASTNENPLQETIAAFDLSVLSAANENLTVKGANKLNLNYATSFFPPSYNYYFGTAQQGNTSWTLADNTVGSLQTTTATIQGTSSSVYQISTNKTGLMSIARPINLGNTSNTSVLLPVNFTNKNTMVFAVFKNNNIVLKFNTNSISRTFESNALPIGVDVTLVAISYLDNQFYLGSLTTQINQSNQYIIKTPTTPISLASLNSFLDGL